MTRYTGSELFNAFAAHGTTPAEVAAMGRKAVVRQVEELLVEWPDVAVEMTAEEITDRILDFCASCSTVYTP